MTTRRRGYWLAMAATIWKTCFSTLRAAAAKAPRRPRDDHRAASNNSLIAHARSCRVLADASRRYGVALLVPAALVVAARARPDLLADRADVYVGLSADLHRQDERHAGARRADLHRRRDAVGHPVPRPARVFDLIP